MRKMVSELRVSEHLTFDARITSMRIAWLDDSANYRHFTVLWNIEFRLVKSFEALRFCLETCIGHRNEISVIVEIKRLVRLWRIHSVHVRLFHKAYRLTKVSSHECTRQQFQMMTYLTWTQMG